MTGVSTRVLVTLSMVVSGVGSVDALLSGEWDLLVIFLFSLSLHVLLWLRQGAKRRAVSLRPDLACWLDNHADRTGEPFEDVLDRAVAWYHHGLFVGEPPDRP